MPACKKGLIVIYTGFKPHEQHRISQERFEGIFPTIYQAGRHLHRHTIDAHKGSVCSQHSSCAVSNAELGAGKVRGDVRCPRCRKHLFPTYRGEARVLQNTRHERTWLRVVPDRLTTGGRVWAVRAHRQQQTRAFQSGALAWHSGDLQAGKAVSAQRYNPSYLSARAGPGRGACSLPQHSKSRCHAAQAPRCSARPQRPVPRGGLEN